MKESAPIPSNAIIIRRPQLHLKGNTLYFLISSRPFAELTPEESNIWQALAILPKWSDLQQHYGEQARKCINKFVDLNACEIIATIEHPHRKKVLVLEPHSDDAALSVGGTMTLQKNTHEFTIVTLASISNFTSYFALHRDYFNVNTITSLRHDEGMLVAQKVQGKYLTLGLPEATLRYHAADWDLDWFRAREVSIYSSGMRSYLQEDLTKWTQTLQKFLDQIETDEIWFPLGVGPHTDHQLTRDALFSVILENPEKFKNITLKMYLDVPYAIKHTDYFKYLLRMFHEEGVVLLQENISIDSTINQKLHLASIYGSQFKLQTLVPDIIASAKLTSTSEKLVEPFWKIEALPATIDLELLSPYSEAALKLSKKVQRWKTHQPESPIYVLLLTPTGRWQEDAKILLKSFPKAKIFVYHKATAIAELQTITSPNIELHPVKNGSSSWFKQALKLIPKNPKKILFITGTKRRRMAQILSLLWPLSDSIILESIDPFIQALNTEDENDRP